MADLKNQNQQNPAQENDMPPSKGENDMPPVKAENDMPPVTAENEEE